MQEVDDDLSIYMNEYSPFGLCWLKIYQCHMIQR